MRTGTPARFSGLRLMMILIALPVILSLTGCEQIFTYSPLTWAQRDPSNLSTSGKISYATSALSSGDAETLKDAYNVIKDINDPEVQYLASKVAVGASGINEAIKTALASAADIDSLNVDTVLDGIDSTWIANAEVSLLAAITGGEDILPEDNITMAAMLIVKDAKFNSNTFTPLGPAPDFDLSDPANANSTGTDLQKAAFYLQESGYSTDDMDDLLTLAGG